jgi:aldehyde dehydrogenase (NAD+)
VTAQPERIASRPVPLQIRDRFYIGGSWREPAGDAVIEVTSPVDGSRLGSVPEGTPEDAEAAVRAAARAFPAWSRTTVADRVELLWALAARLRSRAEELAWLISAEVGSPIDFSRSQQVGLPVQVTEAIADVLPGLEWVERIGRAQVVREPVGVIAAITPWNYPLHQVIAKLVPALAAGCTVALKPSELAPLSAFALAEMLIDIGLPDGTVNVVTGYGPVAGEALAAHPLVDMVSLTGSGQAGRRVTELGAATVKRVALELGGKSATVVLDDADIEGVVPGAVMHAFRNSGQNCSALSRLIVPRASLPAVEAIAVRVAESVIVGDPSDPATHMGPLISARQRQRVLSAIRAARADGLRMIAGDPDAVIGPPGGHFVRPTVFSPVPSTATIAQEEIFGPVLCILPYEDEADGLRIANDSRYGLSGAVWSADEQRAISFAKAMRTGRVVVNGGRFNVLAPFGGYKQSGTGSELGRYGIEEFLNLKTLQL